MEKKSRMLRRTCMGVLSSILLAWPWLPQVTQAAPVSVSSQLPATASDEPGYLWSPSARSRPLWKRFVPPAGFRRVSVTVGSFGSYLRSLPLLGPDAKVVDFRGTPLYEDGRDPNIAAVVDLDIGTSDLQQCADSIVRLHAEWQYARGGRKLQYKTASGVVLTYQGYLNGDRFVSQPGGKGGVVRTSAAKTDSYRALRGYLDGVFSWLNTGSLARDSQQTSLADVAPGDFFVMSGTPYGHAVLILDVARDEKGRLALLLGQGYMPAQSFHVIRPAAGNDWFVLEPDATEILTPFWRRFPISALRRMP